MVRVEIGSREEEYEKFWSICRACKNREPVKKHHYE